MTNRITIKYRCNACRVNGPGSEPQLTMVWPNEVAMDDPAFDADYIPCQACASLMTAYAYTAEGDPREVAAKIPMGVANLHAAALYVLEPVEEEEEGEE